ncbi:hypothetical protein SAY87_023521 [Trapa incisa]|uniref:UspA domain-containing protein n=1 Tax=Trapa incisa TaxID=236973 RepID=A0AAN7KYX3_9MYRT|nr:hypothetical protein SAY87_023521 [Trapa incisa]
MAGGEKQVMVIGIDESEHSKYALEWTLDRFVAPYASNCPFKLFIVYARPHAASAVCLTGPGGAAGDFLPLVEADLQKTAARVLDNARQICESKSVEISPVLSLQFKAVNDVALEVGEGDPRYVLCEAVDKHHAAILVVGSHGYGTVKRAVLGSVSDYCAHHAHCNVMIVKKPKTKH